VKAAIRRDKIEALISGCLDFLTYDAPTNGDRTVVEEALRLFQGALKEKK
jgi:hypothetical protein